MSAITKKAQAQLDRDYAKERLLSYYVREGQTIYTILRSVNSSGTSRNISLLVSNEGSIEDITYYAAQALGERLVESNGYRAIRQQGGGRDMGFNLVYNLSSVLFAGADRAGYAVKQAWL